MRDTRYRVIPRDSLNINFPWKFYIRGANVLPSNIYDSASQLRIAAYEVKKSRGAKMLFIIEKKKRRKKNNTDAVVFVFIGA